MRSGARAWRHWPSGRGREMRTSRGRLHGRSAVGPLLSAARVQPEVGSPTPFSQFLFTPLTTPLPAGTVVFVALEDNCAGARRAVPGGGDFCGDEKRRPAVGARSALRRLTRRSCPNAESAANAVSSATRPRGEHRSGVGAQRRPSQHEPLPGSARRAALTPPQSGRSRMTAMGRKQSRVKQASFMGPGTRAICAGANALTTSQSHVVRAPRGEARAPVGPACAA
jgi:hypothetical protein